ncbi:hypothetical protein EDB92DRAFT_1954688 [Lactarius akahatsu]|uniref:DUF6533 domain-containing protein n=1 Tax=Lactarius akahatsu TaxID=416441 RepID=A0AAD4L7A0_9AGAM|nr:hypothetical protein EDB92DRAFT_1954688 [Lactarius akahatsu]
MSLAGINLGPHAAEYVYLNSITNLPPLAILYYDYLLTLPLEIQYLWHPNKLGWFTVACLLNRYLPIFGHIPLAPVARLLNPALQQLCQGLHVYHEIFGIFVQSLAGLLCLIRVYALYGRSLRVLGILFSVGIGSILVGCWAMIGSRRAGVETIQVISSVTGCNQYMPIEGGRYAALTWLGMLVFDSAIFSLTLYKAITMGRGIRLLDVIVRDGAMYYSALFIMNLTNILILLFAPPLLKNSTTSITNVLSITLVSRLMLNLRAQSTTQPGLPTSIESERRFQAALPTPPRPPMTGSGSPATRSNKTTWETASVGAAHHVDVVQPSKQAGKTWASAGERT